MVQTGLKLINNKRKKVKIKFKKCSACDKWLPESYFGKNSHRCKTCNRDNDWKRRYNITPDTYFKMLKKQDGKCAICNKEPTDKMLNIDHNHSTGQVRALLCSYCNRALGLMEENNSVTGVFKEYLERYDNEYKRN